MSGRRFNMKDIMVIGLAYLLSLKWAGSHKTPIKKQSPIKTSKASFAVSAFKSLVSNTETNQKQVINTIIGIEIIIDRILNARILNLVVFGGNYSFLVLPSLSIPHASDGPVGPSFSPAVLQIDHGPDRCWKPADQRNLKNKADDEMKDSSS